MSWQAVTWVLEFSEATLGSRLVLLSIASHANREGRNSWPSVATICGEARLTRREVQYCLRELEKIGELKTIQRSGGSSMYHLPNVEFWIGAQTLRGLGTIPAQNTTGRGAPHCAPPAQSSAPPGAHPIAPEPSFEVSVKGKRNGRAPVLLSDEENKTLRTHFLAEMKRIAKVML